MRCSCKACGTYMVQTERGLFSGCQCPECGNICRDCMGSVDSPLTPDQLRERFSSMKLDAVTAEPADPPEWVERPSEWRKMLEPKTGKRPSHFIETAFFAAAF